MTMQVIYRGAQSKSWCVYNNNTKAKKRNKYSYSNGLGQLKCEMEREDKYLSCDINSICRICLKRHGNVSIFRRNAKLIMGYSLVERIMSIACVEIIEDDGLPSLICRPCVSQIDRAFSLKAQCEFADRTLRQYCSDETGCVTFLIPSLKKVKSFNASRHLEEKDGYGTLKTPLHGCDDTDMETGGESHNKEMETKLPEEEGNQDKIDHQSINNSCNNTVTECMHSYQNVCNDSPLTGTQVQISDCCDIGTMETSCETNNSKSLLNVFICELCAREFDSKEKYKIHVSISKYGCDGCSKEFCDETACTFHRKLHALLKKYVCSFCGKTFKCRASLNYHERKHKDIKCYLCSHCGQVERSKRQHYCSVTREVVEKNHPCDVCGKMFASLVTLKTHKKRHSSDMRFQCKDCKKRFFSNQELERHVRVHLGVRPFACLDEECSLTFYSQGELNRHMRYHNGVKNFACNICDRTFYESSHLVNHKRSHTGERPHRCLECPKSFIDSSKLSRHLKIHGKSSHITREARGVAPIQEL